MYIIGVSKNLLPLFVKKNLININKAKNVIARSLVTICFKFTSRAIRKRLDPFSVENIDLNRKMCAVLDRFRPRTLILLMKINLVHKTETG